MKSHDPGAASWSGILAVSTLYANDWTSVLSPANTPVKRGICRYAGEAEALALHIDSTLVQGASGIWNQESRSTPWRAGGLVLSAAKWTQQSFIGCLVQCGFGAVTHSYYFDWAPGSYQLPVCEQATVYAVMYGQRPNIAPILAASLVPGLCAGGQIPTQTELLTVAAGDTVPVSFPPNVRAFEILSGGGTSWICDWSSLPDTYQRVVRDSVAGTFNPPWSPVPIDPTNGNLLSMGVTNNAAAVKDTSLIAYLSI